MSVCAPASMPVSVSAGACLPLPGSRPLLLLRYQVRPPGILLPGSDTQLIINLTDGYDTFTFHKRSSSCLANIWNSREESGKRGDAGFITQSRSSYG